MLARFLDHKLFRLLMLPTRRGMRVVSVATQPLLRAIGRVVGSDVLADTVAFFQAFAGMEAGFRQRAGDVMALVRSPVTRYVVVASPHRETVAEAVWFAEQLRQQGIEQVGGVVNRVHPRFGAKRLTTRPPRASTGREPRMGAPRWRLWTNLAELRGLAASEREEVAPLADALGGPVLGEVPLLATDVHDLTTLTALRAHLFPT